VCRWKSVAAFFAMSERAPIFVNAKLAVTSSECAW
jgi:hypothetical protein